MEAFAQFVPLIIILAIQVAFAVPVCKRKGLHFGWLFLSALPWFGILVLILAASQTDKKILEEIEALKLAGRK